MSVSASLKSKISQMMNDGMSNREILKEVNKILKSQGKDTLHYPALNKIINSLMDDLVPTFDSDEEDEEYVPSESEESDEEDEEYVPSESDDESEASEETEESDTKSEATEDSEKSDEESEYSEEDLCRHPIYIYFNHPKTDTDEHDRLVITPENGVCFISYEYDRSMKKDASSIHSFTADNTATLEYILDIFSLLCIDQKPFTEIEIQIPFYPSFSIAPEKLHVGSISTILRIIGVYLEHTTDGE